MNSLSVENMNGVGHHRRGVGYSPVRAQVPGVRIPPTYAPWWKEIPGPKGVPIRTRRNLEPGQLWKSDEDRPSYPFTPNNDARDLPEAFTGKPLRQLPRRQFTVDFPHTWIPYEEMHVATGPEMGQTIPGWEPIPWLGDEKAKAVRAAMPSPWVAPEAMAYDVSGMGYMPGYLQPGGMYYYGEPGLQGLGQLVSLYPLSGVSQIAAQEGAKAEAAGKSPSAIESIIGGVLSVGTTAYSLYQQKRENDRIKKAEDRRKAQERLAAEAHRNLPADVANRDFGPAPAWYKNPLVIGAGVVAVVVIGGLAFKAFA